MTEAAEKCPFQFNWMSADKMAKGVPFDEFKKARAECPVSLQDDSCNGGTYWAVVNREDIDYISKHPELFSSTENSMETSVRSSPLAMLRPVLFPEVVQTLLFSRHLCRMYRLGVTCSLTLCGPNCAVKTCFCHFLSEIL